MSKELEWSREAEARIRKVPFFVRPFARKKVEREALARGVNLIDVSLLEEVKERDMPKDS